MQKQDIIKQLDQLNEQQLRRLLAEHLTKRKLGLVWEADLIERDKALNANVVLPRLMSDLSCFSEGKSFSQNLIIEGDNYDALRLLRTTHRGKIRVIYIDPPYNTGNKDWVYNDRFVSSNDKYRHSQWLEFLYRRLVLARDLLASDGVIMVSINDENRSKLELLMDEVFPNRRLGSLVWRTRQGSNADQGCFLSSDHEHILVYGNSEFKFKGIQKTYEMYGNPDNDPRGEWRSDNITLGFSYKERPNLYYPIFDPNTSIFYPANPDSVWRFASKNNLKEGQTLQAKTMEEFIDIDQVIFPKNQRIEKWETIDDLLKAIDCGDVPKSGKTALLRRDLPNLEFWVGKFIGFGRPQFKRYKADLRNQEQPLSSWITPKQEIDEYENENGFVSGTNQEGSKNISDIFGDRSFNYAKPLSLVKNLLAQSTNSNDIILDFFAGSGTTAHAVLALNNEDDGNRKFILCSSTEATAKEPDKNLCRDVCAERVKAVIQGKNTQKALGGDFAYLQLDRLQSADAFFEMTSEHATLLLALRELQQAVLTQNEDELIIIAEDDTLAIIVCPTVTDSAIMQLLDYPRERISVYSDRPNSIESAFVKAGKTVNSYNLADSLIPAQHQSI